MGIVSWIILGLIAGFIGSKIVGRQGQGFWLDIALGIVGALVGGFLFDLFGASGVTGLNIYSMIVASSLAQVRAPGEFPVLHYARRRPVTAL